MDRNRILTPDKIEGLIADGQSIVVFAGDALRLDGWLGKHPGGRLVIMHMVGRDATDEINIYHPPETRRLMKAYRIGRVQEPWENMVPPIQGGVYRKHGGLEPPATDEEKRIGRLPGDAPACRARRVSPAIAMESKTDIFNEKARDITTLEPDVEVGYNAAHCSGQKSVGARLDEKSAPAFVQPTPEQIARAAFTATLEEQEKQHDIQAYPSLDADVQRAISKEYKLLHDRVRDEGHYTCRYSEYGKESIRYVALFLSFLFLLNRGWYMTSACFLGAFWQQIMFVAHDAGHRGITGSFVADTLIGSFVADFCCGLSIGWWKSSHNVHHLVTNMPEHDPDQQNVPIFATSPTFFKSILSSFYEMTYVWDGAADIVIHYQKYTYYPIMALARFNLYFLSWHHLLSRGVQNHGNVWWTRPVEIFLMMSYWYMFGYILVWCILPDWPTRIGFVLISHIATMLLHVQITLSHWGMPTADLGPTESFPQRQLRTTMDVDCPEWLDWLHGGLQFQAVHHLFPRVPRHNLRSVQTLVRDFCSRVGVEYRCYGFVEGNKVVLGKLDEVARMVDMLVKCQLHMAETGESGLE